jgi:hypothetical protein
MPMRGPGGSVAVFSELQSSTHRFEEINTKNAGYPIVVNDLYSVAIDTLLTWYSEFQFSVTEVLTE